LSDEQVPLPTGVDKQIGLFIKQLRQERNFVIFDNVETLLADSRAGHYLSGYEAYGERPAQKILVGASLALAPARCLCSKRALMECSPKWQRWDI
jgi:hypothetical protein